MELDTEKLDRAALAILSLTLHNGDRVWKGIDWSITDRLHEKGFIRDPVGRTKSIVLTDEGRIAAESALKEFFSAT